MDAIEPNIRALVIFALAWSLCCAGAFQIAGLFPLNSGSAASSTLAKTLAVIDAVLLLGFTAVALKYSVNELRWSSLVVVGGSIFLFAPFVSEDVPEPVKHGKTGLLVLLAALVAAFALFSFATNASAFGNR